MKKQQTFEKLRKNYPQKVKIVSMKSQIVLEWIKEAYYSDFTQIFYEKNIKNQGSMIVSKQKVLDSNDQARENDKAQNEELNSKILQSVKIIVQAYQKNQETSDHFDFQIVQAIVQKARLNMQELLNKNPKISTNNPQKQVQQKKQELNSKPQSNKNTDSEQKDDKKQDKQMSQKKNKLQQKKDDSVKEQIKSNQPPIQEKPKANSLFVQKQIPLAQENIFKGQNNFNRPSSQLGNSNNQHLMNEKPKSSTKSNRSKKSNASSRGQQKSFGKPEDDKKSQNLSDLDIQQRRQRTQNQNQQQDDNQRQRQSEEQQKSDQQQEVGQNQQTIEKTKQIFDLAQQNLHLPSPFRLSNQRPIRKKLPVQSILTNPFIKKAFSHICKQNYIGGGKTFDQIAQSSDIMTTNKWMVFCKEFQFLSKLKKKVLVDIFQQSTDNKPFMSQKQFLNALIIVQSKLKIDEQNFLSKHMCLDSDFAFRQKVASFKVSYTGPKNNCFEQAQKMPVDLYYQNIRIKKYQTQKKKHKQLILHQGKFQQQIISQLSQRKHLRQIQKIRNGSSVIERRNNKSMVMFNSPISSKIVQNNHAQAPYINLIQNNSILNRKNISSLMKNGNLNRSLESSKLNISRRIQPLTYSDIFTQKNSISTRDFTSTKKNSDSSVLPQKSILDKQKAHSKNAGSILSNLRNNTSKIFEKDIFINQTQNLKPQRQWTEPLKNWADQFEKSQSEQSDDILREHLIQQRFRQKHLLQKMGLSQIAQEYKKDQKWLQHSEQQNSEWQRQTQLQATKNKQLFK